MKRKRRKCRCFEITGKKFAGCKGYIDNGNYFFCSFCHREISRSVDYAEPQAGITQIRRK